MNTTQTGDISEQKFVLFCLENNIPISRPIGNNLPYDFIIEYDGRLTKIQVKTGFNIGTKPKVFRFNTVSTSKNFSEIVSKAYTGRIDYFAVVYSGVDFIMLIPVDAVPKHSMVLYYGDSPTIRQNHVDKYRMSIK